MASHQIAFVTDKRYWAKDVVFLVSSEGELGVQAWLSEYTGEKIKGTVVVHRPYCIHIPTTCELQSQLDNGHYFIKHKWMYGYNLGAELIGGWCLSTEVYYFITYVVDSLYCVTSVQL